MSLSKPIQASLALAVLAYPSTARATVLLSDNFTVSGTTNSLDLNYNLSGRQAGSLANQSWTGFNGVYNVQVGNDATYVGQPGGAPNANYLLLATTGKASLTALALNSTTVTAPLLISFDMFNGTNLSDWTAFTLTPATGEGWGYGDIIGFPVPGTAAAFGWRKLGDGTSGVLNVPYVADYVFDAAHGNSLSGNNFSFLLTDTAGTGSAFAGHGTKITMMNGSTTLGTYNMSGTGLTTSYITFSANSGQISGIDNLVIQTVPEPSTTAALLGGIGVLGLLRRRRA
jgi:hypothetical protein